MIKNTLFTLLINVFVTLLLYNAFKYLHVMLVGKKRKTHQKQYASMFLIWLLLLCMYIMTIAYRIFYLLLCYKHELLMNIALYKNCDLLSIATSEPKLFVVLRSDIGLFALTLLLLIVAFLFSIEISGRLKSALIAGICACILSLSRSYLIYCTFCSFTILLVVNLIILAIFVLAFLLGVKSKEYKSQA